MTLWEEWFNPQPAKAVVPTDEEYDRAIAWIFEKDESGEYKHAGLALNVIRRASLNLRKSGIQENTAQMAVVDIFNRMVSRHGFKIKLPIKRVSVRKLPVRKLRPIIPKRQPAK